GLIVISTSSLTAGHMPAGSSVVSVNVTVPAAMSAAPGVYVASGSFTSLNVPSPAVLHVTFAALPPKLPPRGSVTPPAQIICGAPASTVAGSSIMITTLSLAAGQGPAGSLVVKVNVTVPANMSAAPGVYVASGSVISLNVPSPAVLH